MIAPQESIYFSDVIVYGNLQHLKCLWYLVRLLHIADDTFPLGINITGYNEAYLPAEGVHCSARICGLAGICTCTWARTTRSRGLHTG
jgi:hypothetical protein